MSKTIGYARISTNHQNLNSQLTALKKFGCEKIFMEQESGRNYNRRELDRALRSLNPGDTFVTYKLDRLSRSTKHLLTLLDYFNEHDISFISVENNIDTRSSMGKFFFTIMGAFSEMEAEIIRERVLAGLETARENGKQLGRPPENKNEKEVIHQYLNTTMSVTKIAEENKVSRPTVYRYLKNNKIPLKRHTDGYS